MICLLFQYPVKPKLITQVLKCLTPHVGELILTRRLIFELN